MHCVFTYLSEQPESVQSGGLLGEAKKSQCNLDFLWITFSLKFSSMISMLNGRNHWKAQFSYIFAAITHSFSAQQGRASKQPYKR
jgi:hypothetical protein